MISSQIPDSPAPINIGFDFDGVIVYNPFKIIRPIVSILKKTGIIKRKEKTFFIPKTPKQKKFFQILHKSSLFPVPGIDLMVWLAQQPHVHAHIVTGRFHYLAGDFNAWIKRIGLVEKLDGIHHNINNQQPHHFKEKMILELKLDYFVEDNWDIVSYLNEQKEKGHLKKSFQVLWITNILDASIDYPLKFSSLNAALEYIFQDSSRTQPLPILAFSPYFTPYRSGMVQLFKQIMEDNSDRSLFRVLTFRFDRNLARHEYVSSFHIFRASHVMRISKGFISLSLYFKSFFLLLRSKIVYINVPSVEGIPIVILAKLLNKPIITQFTCHIYLGNSTLNQCISRTVNTLSTWQLDQSQAIISLSKDYTLSQNWPTKRLAKTTFISPYVTPLNTVAKNTTQRFPKHKKVPVIGFLGRISSEKGIEYLLEALELVNSTSKAIELWIAGPSPDQTVGEQTYVKSIFARIQQSSINVLRIHNLTEEEKHYFLKTIDVLVLPSTNSTEAFGIVQLEAMLAGTPVIASDLPGVRSIIRTTKFGKIIPPSDAQALAIAIQQLLKHPLNMSPDALEQKLQSLSSQELNKRRFQQIIEHISK